MKEMIFTAMPMFVCQFWSVMLTIRLVERQGNRSHRYLLGFMLTATTLYLGHCAFFNRVTEQMPLLDTLYLTCNLAVYPLFFMYISALTNRREHHQLQWLTLLPTAVGGTACAALYVLMSAEETRLFIDLYLYRHQIEGLQGLAMHQAFVHDTCKVLFALQIVPVCVLGRRYLHDFDRLVGTAYADTEHKTLDAHHWLLVLLAVTSAASFVANIIGRHHFTGDAWLLAIPSVTFSALLFAIGYAGYAQQFSIDEIERDEQEADAAPGVQDENTNLRQQIEGLMMEQQLFLQPNLRIMDLVQMLGTNRNYLYRAINREMGMSFTEYVNRKRIDYAVSLMVRFPDMSLTEVARSSGFTSNASFYRNFKMVKGVGPRDYQNKLNQMA